MIERSCFVRNLKTDEVRALRGLTVDPGTGHLLLIHPEKREIVVLEGKSCASLDAQRLALLPKNLPSASALMIDEARNLWLSHEGSEDVTSASAFSWPQSAWLP